MHKLDLQPNTPEWLDARAQYRTASEAAIVCGKSPFTSPAKFKLIKAGLAKQFYSRAMALGHELEDQIRQWANTKLDKDFREEVWVNGEYLASLDGIDDDTVLEIKTSSRTFQDIQNGDIPEYYWLQMQQQLHCSPATHAYLVAYCPKSAQYAISERIDEDHDAMNQIAHAWADFDAMPVPEGDIEADDNVDLYASFQKYHTAKNEIDRLEKSLVELKQQILTFAADRTVNCRGYSIVYKKPVTKVDYKKACTDAKLDLNSYSKVSEPSYMLKMATPEFPVDTEDE